MTLYEAISARRQVRSFRPGPVDETVLDQLRACLRDAERLSGRQGQFEVVPAKAAGGSHGAPWCVFSFCEEDPAAYANAGYVLQKADLLLQSLGLGCGWFMDLKPAQPDPRFCIGLAFGHTDEPLRTEEAQFKRRPLSDICREENDVARAVRLTPSSLNSQPWTVEFEDRKVVLREKGRGPARLILRGKLNKIDLGIAARHAALALEHQGKRVVEALPKAENGKLEITIRYE